MKRFKNYRGIAACVAVLFFTQTMVASETLYLQPDHQIMELCEICHGDSQNYSNVKNQMEAFCISCHAEMAEFSHPVNIVPELSIPPEFPLISGKLTCLSCHSVHSEGDQSADDTQPPPFLLRSGMGNVNFCFQCHNGTETNTASDAHAVATGKAHSLKTRNIEDFPMSTGSGRCLGCHDGLYSSDVHIKNMGGLPLNRFSGDYDHPIGIDYQEAYLSDASHLQAPGALDPRIMFVDGTVECESCHNSYSENNYMLVIENTNSSLCFACHDM